ncbi:hypothetical protein L3Q82_009061, partial [Scortum barcoo]
SGSSRCILEEPVNWADGFVAGCSIVNRVSFLHAKKHPAVDQRGPRRGSHAGGKRGRDRFLAQEDYCRFQEVSTAEDYTEVLDLFTNSSVMSWRTLISAQTADII